MIRVSKMHRRRNWECKWRDPVTGRILTRSTGTRIEREAETFRVKLEISLNDGTFREMERVTWDQFVEEYKSVRLAGRRSIHSEEAMLRLVKDHVNPAWPTAFGPKDVTKLEQGMADYAAVTRHRHLGELRRLLEWGHSKHYVKVVPQIDQPDFEEDPRGRPLKLEEFERLLMSTEAVVGPPRAPAFRHLLQGLWLSGLRISEATDLSWTAQDRLWVDFERKRPVFRIRAKANKNKKYQILPMVPEFGEFLLKTPQENRDGYVFDIPNESGQRMTSNNASRTISAIGRKANVIVDQETDKAASAHDLRRSFGERWSWKVRQRVLGVLMRHRAASTTEKFYQSHDAQEVAENVWEAIEKAVPQTHAPAQSAGDTFGDTLPSVRESGTRQTRRT